MAKRRVYTKLEVERFMRLFCEENISGREFAKKHDLPESSLRRMLNTQEQPKAPRKQRTTGYEDLETQLYAWITEGRSKGLIVVNGDIRAKALEIAAVQDIGNEIKASNCWLSKFRRRKKLTYRVPTHASRKVVFSEADELQHEQFFEEPVEAIDVDGTTKENVLNMDQLNVRLVDPQKKTISPMGLKQVNVIHPPGDKEGFTVTLGVSADGRKMPATIVFKGAQKIGVLSDRILSKLNVPRNVVVDSFRSAWWTEALNHRWIKAKFSMEQTRNLLVEDQFSVHKMNSSAVLLDERNVRQIFVPVAMTGSYQPLDVGINLPFKVYYSEQYAKWRKTHQNQYTKSGYLVKPGRQDFCNMVPVTWAKITPESVQKAFVKAQIVSEVLYADDCGGDKENTDADDSYIELSFFDENDFEDDDDDVAL